MPLLTGISLSLEENEKGEFIAMIYYDDGKNVIKLEECKCSRASGAISGVLDNLKKRVLEVIK